MVDRSKVTQLQRSSGAIWVLYWPIRTDWKAGYTTDEMVITSLFPGTIPVLLHYRDPTGVASNPTGGLRGKTSFKVVMNRYMKWQTMFGAHPDWNWKLQAVEKNKASDSVCICLDSAAGHTNACTWSLMSSLVEVIKRNAFSAWQCYTFLAACTTTAKWFPITFDPNTR